MLRYPEWHWLLRVPLSPTSFTPGGFQLTVIYDASRREFPFPVIRLELIRRSWRLFALREQQIAEDLNESLKQKIRG
jgi:hypothetical protein